MTINIDVLFGILGLIVNIMVIVGVSNRLENRLTKLETTISLLLRDFKLINRRDINDQGVSDQ
jgi:hypothetical protein